MSRSAKNFKPFREDFESKTADPILYNILQTLHSTLISSRRNPIAKFSIEELRGGKSFFYTVENNELGLLGHIGRNIKTGKVTYLIVDQARLKWAKMEGFTEENGYDRTFIYKKIGVFRKLPSVTDFINFIDGKPEVTYCKNYYLAGTP